MKVYYCAVMTLLLLTAPVFAQQASHQIVSPEVVLTTSNECKVQPSLFTIEKTLSRGNVLHTSSSLNDSDKTCIKNVLSRQKIVVQDSGSR